MIHDGVHWQDFVKAMLTFLFHENRKLWSVATVLWLRRLDADLSCRRTGFSPESVHMRVFAGKTSLEKTFLHVLQFSAVRVFLSSLHSHSLVADAMILSSDRAVKWAVESLISLQRSPRSLAHSVCFVDKILKLFPRLS